MNWFSRHANLIEAGAAAITALVALAALIGVKVQLDATDLQQRTQSARDAYRSHLALASTSPDFASPTAACQLLSSNNAGAYAAFVDHLLYSAEQMLEVEPGWEDTFVQALLPHSEYMCSEIAPTGSTLETKRLLSGFKAQYCTNVIPCL
ncbi:hypothetical protein [Maritalea porphyrae]|jgi:hypothetical protein|uniref:hypothetical protein n=1 Tax=Maritalea porphyrae TaxID=880732 RepID=UPI0022AF0D99|nr:hypothetical protein [Maritalea porphyrae]MCZ4273828.1 hypothetical protein [Maritalea porphyrae]